MARLLYDEYMTRQQYTPAKRRQLEAERAAQLEQNMRTYAAMSLEDYVAMRVARVSDLATWCQDAEAAAAAVRHAELVNLYS